MDWRQRTDTVHYIPGVVYTNNIAVFDFDQTLAWSDSGLIYMRTADDWTSTTSPNQLLATLTQLVRDHWTIVILVNALENDPEFTRKGQQRILNFIMSVRARIINVPRFEPFIYMAIRDDEYRKPRRGMWDLFLQDTGITPSAASFYCGDAQGPQATNPLYRWADHDVRFAEACGLAYYNPEEMLGTFISPPINLDTTNVIMIMAAHPSQYRIYLDNFLREHPEYVETNLAGAAALLQQGRRVIITGERFARQAGRWRARHFIPPQYHQTTLIFMFTRPIRPFMTQQEYAAIDYEIRGYANALDFHPHLVSTAFPTGEPFGIIRIN